MGWILMQPADDEESVKATTTLIKTGICLFDISKNGARLKPIAFGSHSCNSNEKNLHSFTGEAACGRWEIGQNRRFLWGSHFWWLCDCSAMTEILEYDGPIAMICRWAQELLGYNFTVVHRPSRMMIDVDALSRRYGTLITTHCIVSSILHGQDVSHRPAAYDRSTFLSSLSSKLPPPEISTTATPILSSSFFTSSYTLSQRNTSTKEEGSPTISTSPMLFLSGPTDMKENQSPYSLGTEMRIAVIAKEHISEWLCINETIG